MTTIQLTDDEHETLTAVLGFAVDWLAETGCAQDFVAISNDDDHDSLVSRFQALERRFQALDPKVG